MEVRSAPDCASPIILATGSPYAGWQAIILFHSAGRTACAAGWYGPNNGAVAGGARESAMPTTLKSVVKKYLCSGSPAQRTREQYTTTLRKWSRWGGAVSLERLGRKEIREFLDWVHKDASRKGRNPGRTTNKVRSHLRAALSWVWAHDLVDAVPRFPRLKPQRDVAGRHYLTKPELNALRFATHQMKRPRGWSHPWPVGRYWPAALVVFFNYGVDTGTVWKTLPFHKPIRRQHISWGRQCPDREIKESCRWGWIYYRRVKTGKPFCGRRTARSGCT